jgi:hypothetical protein
MKKQDFEIVSPEISWHEAFENRVKPVTTCEVKGMRQVFSKLSYACRPRMKGRVTRCLPLKSGGPSLNKVRWQGKAEQLGPSANP